MIMTCLEMPPGQPNGWVGNGRLTWAAEEPSWGWDYSIWGSAVQSVAVPGTPNLKMPLAGTADDLQ